MSREGAIKTFSDFFSERGAGSTKKLSEDNLITKKEFANILAEMGRSALEAGCIREKDIDSKYLRLAYDIAIKLGVDDDQSIVDGLFEYEMGARYKRQHISKPPRDIKKTSHENTEKQKNPRSVDFVENTNDMTPRPNGSILSDQNNDITLKAKL